MSTLHLMPVGLAGSQAAPETVTQWLPAGAQAKAQQITVWIVENAKTARAFLKMLGTPHVIREMTLYELRQDTPLDEIRGWLKAHEGAEVGVMSEAGCPAVADPGAMVARVAHELGWQVMPWVGPSSILLGLMASGLDGQRFAFHGYAAVDKGQLAAQLKRWEQESRKLQQTQLWIETPYRNDAMLETLIATLHDNTRLCVACHLACEDQWVRTLTIREWKQAQRPQLHKKPTLFLMLAS